MHHATCQCGALTATANAAPDFVIACNCKLCQRRSGSPFGAAGYFRKSTLTLAGRTARYGRTADSGRKVTNFFCPTCGTTLYWTLDMRPDHIGVAFGAFEQPLPEPARVIWTESQHDWVAFPTDLPHFAQGTPE